MTLYEVLGVTEAATEAEIKKAFRQLALDTHPDHHPGNSVKEARFKQIAEAYEALSDPKARSRYDDELRQARQAERLRAEAEQARRAQAWSQQARAPEPNSAPQAHGSVKPEGGTFLAAVLAGLGIFGLAALALQQTSEEETRWDPNVGRNRGPDGRFRAS